MLPTITHLPTKPKPLQPFPWIKIRNQFMPIHKSGQPPRLSPQETRKLVNNKQDLGWGRRIAIDDLHSPHRTAFLRGNNPTTRAGTGVLGLSHDTPGHGGGNLPADISDAVALLVLSHESLCHSATLQIDVPGTALSSAQAIYVRIK